MSLALIILYAAVHLSLDSCLSYADSHNADILNSRLAVSAAEYQRGEALAAYFPSVSFSAFGYHALNPLINITLTDVIGTSSAALSLNNLLNDLGERFDISTSYKGFQRGSAAGFQLTQPLFVGGRIVTANRMAKLGYEAAKVQNGLTVRNSHEEIEKTFWQVIALQEKHATLSQLSLLLDTIERDVRSAVSSGLVSENDLLKVELKRGELNSGMLEVANGVRLSKMNLLNSIGMPFTLFASDTVLPLLDSITLVCEPIVADSSLYDNGMMSLSVSGLPETQLLDMQVRLKELERRMTLGEALPQVGVGGTYGYSHLNTNEQWNGLAYVMLTVPLSDWGKTARKMQRQKAQLEMAKNDRDHLKNQLLLQLRMLWMNLETRYRQVQVAEQNLAVAQVSYDQQAARFRSGMIAVSDLLECESSLRQAAESRLQSLIAYREALTAFRLRVANVSNP